MVEIVAALSTSQRTWLVVNSTVLVTLTLGVIIQGRLVDEHVGPPGNLRAGLVAVEIFAASVFFLAAVPGVYACLYLLAEDRPPTGAERSAIDEALITTALAAFLFTIARRVLPACWPAKGEVTQAQVLSRQRFAVAMSLISVVYTAGAIIEADTTTRMVIVGTGAIALGAYVFFTIQIERLGDKPLLTFRLRRRGWIRIDTRPVKGGPLEGVSGLPVAFVPASQTPADPRLWLSVTGLRRIKWLLRDRQEGENRYLLLRWTRRRHDTRANKQHPTHVVLTRRHDVPLYLAERGLGLIERADARPAPSAKARCCVR
jgi:hypothetical protein